MTAPAHPPVEYQDRHTIRGDLREGFHDVLAHRELLFQLAGRDIKLRYKQAVMGFAWAIFMPILVVMAGLVVRLAMAHVSGRPVVLEGMAGVAVKALPWAFFVGAVGFASNSLIANQALVSKVFFPREVLPLSAVVAQGFDTLIGAVALIIALPFLGAKLSLALLWVAPLALLLFVLTATICLFLACANLFFRDVKYIVQVLLTFGIFFTPVFYEPGLLGERGARLLMLNPMAALLEALRVAVIDGHNLLVPLVGAGPHGASETVLWAPWYLGYAAAWALGGLAVSLLIFRRLSYLFAEYI